MGDSSGNLFKSAEVISWSTIYVIGNVIRDGVSLKGELLCQLSLYVVSKSYTSTEFFDSLYVGTYVIFSVRVIRSDDS